MNQPWHAAIAAALTGEELDLGVQPFPDPVALEHQLAAAGWSAARLLEHARATAAREEPWPHAIPEALRPGLGAAQLHAAIGRARDHLGLAVLAVLPPSRRTRLDADERRLLADVPPHFGRT